MKSYHTVAVLLMVLFSCSSSKRENINVTQKKRTFIKILGFLKGKNTDSLTAYLPLEYSKENDQKDFTMRNIDEASYIVSHSTKETLKDSILIVDSTVLNIPKPLYHYSCNFYNDSGYVGNIKMTFYGNENNLAINLFADKKYVPLGDSAIEKINKILSK